MRRFIGLFLAVVAGLAAGGDPAPGAEEARIQACCTDITARVEAYLGKKFKAPIPVSMKSKEEMAAFAIEEAEKMKDLTEAAQRLFERLHLVPPGYDVLAREAEMLKEGVVGLYDPDADRFYVVRGIEESGSMETLVTVAHELVHAYRDVDKDYWEREHRLARTNGDEGMALRFLVEGDATILGMAIGQATLAKADAGQAMQALCTLSDFADEGLIAEALADPNIASFPRVLKESLIAPYYEGAAFAAAVFRAGGKEALDKAYDRPPRSTEQVLHPAKYLSEPDEPTEFQGGDPLPALGEGWKLRFGDVMGEFDLRVMLSDSLGRHRARAVAAGWDGSRYWLCEKEGAPSFFGMSSIWDTPEDAAEFAQAWADWALQRDGKEGEVGGRGGEWRVETKEGAVIVRQKGALVLVADGVPRDRADAVLAAMAAARAVERKPE